MTLVSLIIGAIIGYIIGCVLILVGVSLYDALIYEEGPHMVRSSEVQRIKEELLRESQKK